MNANNHKCLHDDLEACESEDQCFWCIDLFSHQKSGICKTIQEAE